ncbi:MAG: hypothetical protein KGJ23_13795 [Euryarchaeota archaeon]|nr:hypothetical protein [Euryarchaeota archaeon]MDE1837670.1 hypothetical protein [Euryarchaeota archaeon]MDE1880345.1 hypothetical protein [Euryarchaeota archaeon]MDE2046346.1 hypothetical protein [Thermoplasmata archaeon]
MPLRGGRHLGGPTIVGTFLQNLGIIVFTFVLVGLVYYLLYALVHPERL